jgi:hypothetical protein
MNLMVFTLGNILLYFFLQADSKIDLMRVVMCSAVFTVIHLFMYIDVRLMYHIRHHVSAYGRGWCWSTMMVSLVGMRYYALLTYHSLLLILSLSRKQTDFQDTNKLWITAFLNPFCKLDFKA